MTPAPRKANSSYALKATLNWACAAAASAAPIPAVCIF